MLWFLSVSFILCHFHVYLFNLFFISFFGLCVLCPVTIHQWSPLNCANPYDRCNRNRILLIHLFWEARLLYSIGISHICIYKTNARCILPGLRRQFITDGIHSVQQSKPVFVQTPCTNPPPKKLCFKLRFNLYVFSSHTDYPWIVVWVICVGRENGLGSSCDEFRDL